MADERERDRARLEIQKNMTQATHVSQMRQSVMKGRTFKIRYLDKAMEPALVPGDVIEVGGATVMQYKAGDLVYYHAGDLFYVRRIVRHNTASGEMAFMVKTEATDEIVSLGATQIIGRVINIERRGETINLVRKRADTSEMGPLAGVVNLVQDVIDRITKLVERIRRRQ